MPWVVPAITAGSAILGAVSSSSAAKKSASASKYASDQANAVQMEQLALERARDTRAQKIEAANNAMLQGRQQISNQSFDALARSIMSMDTNRGVGDAISTLEGNAGVARRSLRSDLGGGVVTAKTGALGLATNRARAQLTNQITSSNINQKQQALASISAPVLLQTPGAVTSGGAAGSLASGFYNQASEANNTANAYRAASGQMASTATQVLMDTDWSQFRTPSSSSSYTTPSANAQPAYGLGRDLNFNFD